MDPRFRGDDGLCRGSLYDANRLTRSIWYATRATVQQGRDFRNADICWTVRRAILRKSAILVRGRLQSVTKALGLESLPFSTLSFAQLRHSGGVRCVD